MLRSLLLSVAVTTGLSCLAEAQAVPTGFTVDTLVSSVLNGPHDFTQLPDGRVLICNHAGPVVIYAGGAPVTIGTVANVQTSGEQGLLSIAADPNFDTNGYVYVWYSSSSTAFMHLERFTCTGVLNNPGSTALTLDLTSRRVILASTPDSAFNHNGGSVRFGPDGMLYLSIGDDATGGCPSQSTTSWLGCVMRMDVSTLPAGGSTTPPAIATLDPGTNPLSANADISQLVIAHGLRNPFRMEIDQLTGNLYIGDVGQNAVEEYSEYVYPSVGSLPLRNFGWPWLEGNNSYSGCGGSQPPGLVAPIAAIPQGGSWGAVMGGARYRNQGGANDFGASYEGSAFYLDYYAGQVRRMVNTGTWGPAPAVPGQPNATDWANGFVRVTALRQAQDGSLLFTQHGSSLSSGGFLKRIRPLGPTNSVAAVSGGGQIANAGDVFPLPILARVFDPSNNPLPFGTVNFAITGNGTLTTTNPVIADANGFVQTSVNTIASAGGAITVTATTPGGITNATFALFSRRLTVTAVSTFMVVSMLNSTTAVPANVSYILMASFPHTPVLPTPIGILSTNPYVSTTLVLEDALLHFPRPAWAGTGGVGNPGFTKVYTPPLGIFSGYTMTFQAVGFDPGLGIFLTNVETKQF